MGRHLPVFFFSVVGGGDVFAEPGGDLGVGDDLGDESTVACLVQNFRLGLMGW